MEQPVCPVFLAKYDAEYVTKHLIFTGSVCSFCLVTSTNIYSNPRFPNEDTVELHLHNNSTDTLSAHRVYCMNAVIRKFQICDGFWVAIVLFVHFCLRCSLV